MMHEALLAARTFLQSSSRRAMHTVYVGFTWQGLSWGAFLTCTDVWAVAFVALACSCVNTLPMLSRLRKHVAEVRRLQCCLLAFTVARSSNCVRFRAPRFW